MSVYLRADRRGAGLGRRLSNALLDVLARQGYRQAFAGIALPNDPSVALHEAMGFEPVGVARRVGCKLGAWHDVGQWQRPLSAANGAPSEPIPITDLDPVLLTTILTANPLGGP